MNNSKTIFLVLLLIISSVVYPQSNKDVDFVIPRDSIFEISNPLFSHDAFFIGRDYHHNTFKDQEKGLKNMAACYFTVADAADPQNLKLCEELGLSVVVSVNPHLYGNEWEMMSDEQIDQYIKKMVKNGGKSEAIIGYHICDEPSSKAFYALSKAVKAVRKYAPGKWSLINLYPNYATIWTEDKIKSQLGTKSYLEYLEKFIDIVDPDIITYDNYMIQMSMDLKQPNRAEKYFTNLVDVRRVALANNIPFWNVVSGNQVRPHTTIPSPANLALQAYTSLAAGVSGIRWFTYYKGGYDYAPIDENENRTLTWRYLQEINRQAIMLGVIIKQLKSTGVYFTNIASESSLPLLPGEHVQSVETDVPMMIGEFLSRNNYRYVMVVNLSLEKTAKFILNTSIINEQIFSVSLGEEKPFLYDFEMAKMTSINAGQGWSPKADNEIEKGYWLPAGCGVLIQCTGKSK